MQSKGFPWYNLLLNFFTGWFQLPKKTFFFGCIVKSKPVSFCFLNLFCENLPLELIKKGQQFTLRSQIVDDMHLQNRRVCSLGLETKEFTPLTFLYKFYVRCFFFHIAPSVTTLSKDTVYKAFRSCSEGFPTVFFSNLRSFRYQHHGLQNLKFVTSDDLCPACFSGCSDRGCR